MGRYGLEGLRYDMAAGLSGAAVAVPVAIAYAQLAGFPLSSGFIRPSFRSSSTPLSEHRGNSS